MIQVKEDVESWRADLHRAARHLLTGNDVQRVQAEMVTVIAVLVLGNNVDDLPAEINHRGRGDPDFGSDVRVETSRCGANILAGHRASQRFLPQNDAFGIIRIEGINRVVLRGY